MVRVFLSFLMLLLLFASAPVEIASASFALSKNLCFMSNEFCYFEHR